MGVQNVCMEVAAEMAGKMALQVQTRIRLPVYFWFTSGLLPVQFWFFSGLIPRNAGNTDAGPLVPLDAGSHIFYILIVFHLYFNDLSFVFPFPSGKASENLPGTSRNGTNVKSKKMNFQ